MRGRHRARRRPRPARGRPRRPAHRGAAAVDRLHGVRVGERGPLRRRHRVPGRPQAARPRRRAGLRRPDAPVRRLGARTPSRVRRPLPADRGHRSGHGRPHRVRGQQAARRWPRACPPRPIDALDDVYERWDGLGIPDGKRGDQLTLLGRVVHVAEQAVFAHADGGIAGAVAEVRRRAGGHLDPDLAAVFVRDADALLAPLDAPDLLAAVVAADPGRAGRAPTGWSGSARRSPSSPTSRARHLVGHSAARGARWPTPPQRSAGLARPRVAAGRRAAARPRAGRRVERGVGPAGPARPRRPRAGAAARLLDRTDPAPLSRPAPRSPSSPPPTTSAATAAATTAASRDLCARGPDPGRRRRLRRGHRGRAPTVLR